MKRFPVFDISRCVSCGICIQACPVSCLSLTKRALQGKYRNVFPEMCADNCLGCRNCCNSCPMDCILMKEAAHEG